MVFIYTNHTVLKKLANKRCLWFCDLNIQLG